MPVTTRRMQELQTATLVNLPAEILDRIFDLVYADKRIAGPLCRKLLPFHRRRITSLRLPSNVEMKHVKAFLPHLVQLRKLHLVESAKFRPLFGALPRPEDLVELTLFNFDFTGRKKDDVSSRLAIFTSLETFRLNSYCDVKHIEPFFAALAALPSVKHLVLGHGVRIDARQLTSALDTCLGDHLSKLTLDFFDGEHGDSGEDHEYWPEFLSSWDLPHWRQDFGYWDLSRIISLAEEKDIEVSGSVVQAIEVEEAFKEEKENFWELANERREEEHYGRW